MLPEYAVILLVHADGVLDGERLAPAVAEMSVEVADQAQAVAAQLKAVGAHAHAILADIECVLSPLGRAGITVGDHHLGKRGSVEDRPLAVLVMIAQVMQRQAFPRIEADDEAPLLPANLVALHLEARPLRLVDLERLDVVAQAADPIGGVIGLARRQCPVAVFLDPDHLHGVQINDRAQAFDGANIPVVGRVGSEEAERSGEPLGAVFLRAVVARAPDVDHDQTGLFHSRVPLQGRAKLGAGQHRLLALDLFINGHGRLDARHVFPVQQKPVRQGERCLVTGIGGVIEENGKRLAWG